MYAGLVDAGGNLQLYDGGMRFVDAAGKIVVDQMAPQDYQQLHRRSDDAYSYLKAPYFKPLGFPNGVYRVGPLARLNVANRCGTPLADVEFAEFHQRFGRWCRARSISTTPD